MDASNPCQDSGQCKHLTNSNYKFTCLANLTGSKCQITIAKERETLNRFQINNK